MPQTTPATMVSPTKPASWSWEATSESVAERYGIPLGLGAGLGALMLLAFD